MSTLFNIFAVPPTRSELDAEHRRTERRLRLARKLKDGLQVFTCVAIIVGCWRLFDFIADEQALSRIALSVFCGALAAAWIGAAVNALIKFWAGDLDALGAAPRLMQQQVAKLADEHSQISRYMAAIDKSRPLTRGECDEMREFARTAGMTASQRRREKVVAQQLLRVA